MKSLPVTTLFHKPVFAFQYKISTPYSFDVLKFITRLPQWSSEIAPGFFTLIWRPIKSGALKMPSPCLTMLNWSQGERSRNSLLKWSHLAIGTVCNGALCWQFCQAYSLLSECIFELKIEPMCDKNSIILNSGELGG